MELVLSKKIMIMELVGRQLMCLLWRGSLRQNLRQNLREEKNFERKMNFSFKKNLRKTITRISIR